MSFLTKQKELKGMINCKTWTFDHFQLWESTRIVRTEKCDSSYVLVLSHHRRGTVNPLMAEEEVEEQKELVTTISHKSCGAWSRWLKKKLKTWVPWGRTLWRPRLDVLASHPKDARWRSCVLRRRTSVPKKSSLDRKEGKDNPERTPDYRHHQIFGIMKLTIHLYRPTVLVREDL